MVGDRAVSAQLGCDRYTGPRVLNPRLDLRPVADNPITALLTDVARGDVGADERLAAAVLERLERIAARELAQRNRGNHDGLTLEPAVFAHDTLLRLLEGPIAFDNRRHFFAYATTAIVRSIIDYQRQRATQRRGGELIRVTLSGLAEGPDLDLEAVPPVLEELERLDQRKADVVRLRVFWGASMEEIADSLGVSPSSVERDWRFARRWLAVRLGAAAGAHRT